MTPFELYSGQKPSVRHLKPFGITAFIGVPKQSRTKFDARAKKGVLVGYAFKTKGYRLWLPNEDKIIETINVSFQDNLKEDRNSGAVLGSKNSKTHNVYYSDPDDYDSRESSESEYKEEDQPKYTIYPHYKPPESSSEEESAETSEGSIETTPLRTVTWIRKAKTRPDRSRTDIYYYEQGKNQRLRSQNDVKKYCQENGIEFVPPLFCFKGSNKYEGVAQSSNLTDISSEHTSIKSD